MVYRALIKVATELADEKFQVVQPGSSQASAIAEGSLEHARSAQEAVAPAAVPAVETISPQSTSADAWVVRAEFVLGL